MNRRDAIKSLVSIVLVPAAVAGSVQAKTSFVPTVRLIQGWTAIDDVKCFDFVPEMVGDVAKFSFSDEMRMLGFALFDDNDKLLYVKYHDITIRPGDTVQIHGIDDDFLKAFSV